MKKQVLSVFIAVFLACSAGFAAEDGAGKNLSIGQNLAIGVTVRDFVKSRTSLDFTTLGVTLKSFSPGDRVSFEGTVFETYNKEFLNLGVEFNCLFNIIPTGSSPYLGFGAIGNYDLKYNKVTVAGALKAGVSLVFNPVELFGEAGVDTALFKVSATNIFVNAGIRFIL